jgi:glycosyltransferase involved in cell wall biosynthesis
MRSEPVFSKANGKSLTIIIPAKNEEFLGRTLKSLLSTIENENTDIVVVLDGYTVPIGDLPKDGRISVIENKKSIGQRASVNKALIETMSEYVMKIDAHCSFDKGFDRKMLEAFNRCDDNTVMVPVMRNLHAFDWVCSNGHRRYQGPSGVCEVCGEPTTKDVVWIAKSNPQSTAYRFDKDMHFQYWNEFGRKQRGDLTETLNIQGSCFMTTRENFLKLDLCSEDFNSWGQQGVEVACKTWLSGGKVLVNRKTWYAHMFRTQGGDFGFPYDNPEDKVLQNRELSKELFLNNKWNKAVHPFSWLLEKFGPVLGWEDK